MSLVLRHPRPSDAPRWWEVATDPAQRALGAPAFVPAPESVDAVAAMLDTAPLAPDVPQTYAVVDDADHDRLLGDVAWRRMGHEGLGVVDIGYAVHPDARGRGVARGAIGLTFDLLTTADDGPRAARVQLDHSVENPASCRAALAAGFAIEGRRAAFLPLRGADGTVRRHDVCLHGRVADGLTAPVSGA